ncbi:DUF4123 domain-containing protein [Pseudomonas segetis]|uniref:DUF4123 domain-containing protein n=1 Tax=Pseudomonas segetis TaxID=298908 RepID=A0A239GM78_9PSED|nr:DUF4123 domain-containing protein [Pseudomonas segetis]SNS70081.1 protein of unknown function [Pseudomonas segetis]
MTTFVEANYLLVDGVINPDALVTLYQRGEALDIQPLYIGTRWAELHDIGPILVCANGGRRLIDEWAARAMELQDACFLSSSAPIQTLADHLRHLISPPDVLGGEGLLRFADPLVAQHWLASYPQQQLNSLLGPIEAWSTPVFDHSWEPAAPIAWQRFTRTEPAQNWKEHNALLGQEQLDALDSAARWRFMERLNEMLQQHYPQLLAQISPEQRTYWFDQRLNEAQAWGLATERSLAIWVEYSLRWGEGFTLRANGPYQQWLERTPEALKLAPEMRIQQMDNDCLAIEFNKDVS